jgi:hypothetical protein
MLFYCKAYYKSTYEKKSGFGGANNAGGQGGFGSGYNETISKPTFLLKEKEKDVYLNGEVTALKEVPGYNDSSLGNVKPMRRTIKKTNVCLKCLQVDDNLRA